jgi:toxin ParE1/3/4
VQLLKPQAVSVRSWPVKGFGNYPIFYHPTRYGIEIIRIIHGARDIETIVRET